MSWIERTTKKRIKELDEHPELNSNDFEQKGNTLMKNIKFYVIVILAAVLVLALWYQWNHPEIDIFPFHFPRKSRISNARSSRNPNRSLRTSRMWPRPTR